LRVLNAVRWLIRRKRRWITAAVLLFVVMPVASVELTSQSWFCNSCHIMNSYYASWKHGTHKEIECVQCHIPPGAQNFILAKLNGLGQVVDDVLDRAGTKPSALVSDRACTRSGCHTLDKVRKIVRTEGKFFFDHSKHLDTEYLGIDLHCTTCHSHIKGEKHFSVDTDVCVTCHLITPGAAGVPVMLTSAGGSTTQPATMATALAATSPSSHKSPPKRPPPGQCKSCHEAPKKPIEYQGLKIVHADYIDYGAACESCHRGVTAKPAKMDDDHCMNCHEFGAERMTNVADMHKTHTEAKHKVECFECHGLIRHGPVAQAGQLAQLECQSCHTGQHAIQQNTYKLTDAAPHPTAATSRVISPMFMVHVACNGCHTDPRPITLKGNTGAMVAAAGAKSCNSCHGAGFGDGKPGVDGVVVRIQRDTHKLYDNTRGLLPAPTKALSAQDEQLVTEARDLLELVRLDGSWGVHNPKYTERLLLDAMSKLNELQANQPKPPDAGRE
jgi:nitrate/TMAO reductase-like tetraheme cytochrome c subunit